MKTPGVLATILSCLILCSSAEGRGGTECRHNADGYSALFLGTTVRIAKKGRLIGVYRKDVSSGDADDQEGWVTYGGGVVVDRRKSERTVTLQHLDSSGRKHLILCD